ncbi:hypothetical protein I4U23_007509 [Adineta vaga]|nr:hypothetical protein I4U23_007509 [Adineta vaga]
MSSLQVSSSIKKLSTSDFNDRIISLHTSFITRFDSISKANPSPQQLFHSIPIIFHFLRNTLQSQQSLLDEYNNLTNTSQKVIAICTQYIHDRQDRENKFLHMDDKISQTIGQISYVKYCLEQYWTMIRSLEQEIERLQLLLNNLQLLKNDQEQLQTFEENQKIKFDLLIKENENMKNLIQQRKDSIRTIQTQIETDVQELRTLQSLLHNNKLEEKNIHKHWLRLNKQASHLQTVSEQTENMENEYHQRMKTTKDQYELMQKKLNSLTNTYDQANRKLSVIETKETNIKGEIENIKKDMSIEQTRLTEDHQRQLSLYQQNQRKLQGRVKNLTEQLVDTIKDNKKYEHLIQINLLQSENQQYKFTKMQLALKKITHVNNNLEKILQENRLIRSNEQAKLHSIKQVSFQKRKQLILHTKQLHILSIDKHRLTNNIIRNTLDTIRLNSIFHDFTNTEKYFQQQLRQKKTELLNHEKQRALLNRYLHDHDNRIHFLTKKNQLIENELQSKIDQFQSFHRQFLQRKHDRLIDSNKKQLAIYSYQQKITKLDELHKKYDQLEKLSDNEINRITKKIEENELLKLNITKIKQQIINMISQNKRQIDESLLLREKIHLYTQLNDMINQQEDRYSFYVNRFSRYIVDLQQENNRLLTTMENLKTKSMIIFDSHQYKVQKKVDILHINQILSDRPIHIRKNSVQIDVHKTLENYSISVKQLVKIIYQVVQWREKLAWITQRYFTKMNEIRQQIKLFAGNKEMILRYRINAESRQCKAIRAELCLQTLLSSTENNVTYL